jgi:hypothetical protein
VLLGEFVERRSQTMKPAFKHVIAAGVLMLSFAAPVVAGPFEDAILSKSDTQAMFALSRSQWEANVAAPCGYWPRTSDGFTKDWHWAVN